MQKPSWTITKNLIDDVTRAATAPAHLQKAGYAFRLLDDDREVYFHGRNAHNGGEEMFRPLDALQAAYGVTIIQYHMGRDGWVTI